MRVTRKDWDSEAAAFYLKRQGELFAAKMAEATANRDPKDGLTDKQFTADAKPLAQALAQTAAEFETNARMAERILGGVFGAGKTARTSEPIAHRFRSAAKCACGPAHTWRCVQCRWHSCPTCNPGEPARCGRCSGKVVRVDVSVERENAIPK